MIKKAYDKKKGGGTYGRKKQTVISNFGIGSGCTCRVFLLAVSESGVFRRKTAEDGRVDCTGIY